MTDGVKNIPFTREQYRALIKAVYLGRWMANAHRAEDDRLGEYEDIADYVFSLASLFGLGKYADHDESGDHWYPTRLFEEGTGVHRLHHEYDDDAFWDALAEEMARRDIFERHTDAEIGAMSQEEWHTKISVLMDAYDDEFSRHGVERLRTGGDHAPRHPRPDDRSNDGHGGR